MPESTTLLTSLAVLDDGDWAVATSTVAPPLEIVNEARVEELISR